jgi:Polyketide cyclase / dehydrase and lipid transport
MVAMPSLSATVSARIAVPREPLFRWFIPIELPRILVGYGPIPAVVSSSDQTGPWDVVGSSRTVHLAGGATASERVTACAAPAEFAYTVSEFSNMLRFLAVEGRGRWWFAPVAGDPGATDVRWTYTFVARSWPAAALLAPVVAVAWRGFMRRGIDRLATLARAEVREDAGAPVHPAAP